MKNGITTAVGVAGMLISTAVTAQPRPSSEPAPGSAAIMKSDFSTAEREIRGADVSPYDPARSINLGIVFAKTGRADKAEREFREVLREDDVQIIVANGKTYSSHDVASRALAALQSGALSK
jgi:Flp pilus assembly protein TadD